MMITRRCAAAGMAIVIASALTATGLATAQADATAYLINVTVRPGYHFVGPDDALQYGYTVCDEIIAGLPYAALIDKVKADMQTADEYQGAYLINQAANELCPAQIWQLRQSAAGYHARTGSQ